MSYQVLARKWRPQRFEDMVGQEHVLQALMNALNTERLHHAYLFTGTRGVGKTTVARLVAKGLNCEQGVTSSPCGQCGSCQEIEAGNYPDLIEVDAASRTKVEDTRDLLENVQYAPTRGRFKVYLIDEVHMLSTHSFNALLKTLEEPPPHVKFLLATTDPQKLPVTILSRCLQFNLKRMSLEQIAEQLNKILNAESVQFEPAAIKPLAIAADGSMRDALSLLDQAIAYGNGQLLSSEVSSMLGVVNKDFTYQLLNSVAANDAEAAVQFSRELFMQGLEVDVLLSELTNVLQAVALQQQAPGAVDELLFDRENLSSLASQLAPEIVQLFYQMCLQGRQEVALSALQQSAFEMILLRMLTFNPAMPIEESASVKKNSKNPVEAPLATMASAPSVVGLSQEASQATAPEQLIPQPTVESPPANSQPVSTIPVSPDTVVNTSVSQPVSQEAVLQEPGPTPELIQEPVVEQAATPAQNDFPQTLSESIPLDAYQDSIPPLGEPDAQEADLSFAVNFSETSATAAQSTEVEVAPELVIAEPSSPSEMQQDEQVEEIVRDTLSGDLFAQMDEQQGTTIPDLVVSTEINSTPKSSPTSTGVAESEPVEVSEQFPVTGAGQIELLATDNWSSAVQSMDLKGIAQQLARNSVVLACVKEDGKVKCQLGMSSQQSQLKNDKMQQRVKESIQSYLHAPVALEYVLLPDEDARLSDTPEKQHQEFLRQKQRAAEAAFNNDEKVLSMVSRFDAKIIEQSICPVD